jgi:transcriptional regulator with XRE-family HTH domain
MNTAVLIDQARARSSISSDYKLAQLLGVSRQVVSQWRNGVSFPTTRTLFDLAELAKRNPAEVIAEIEQERELRAGRLEAAEGWRNTLQRLAGVAAGLAVVSMTSAPVPAAAAAENAQAARPPVYLMSTRKRWRQALQSLKSGPVIKARKAAPIAPAFA